MGKTRHGNMSKREAEATWNEMKDIPGIKSDSNGPRGTFRMKIPLGDYESSFSEFGDEEELEAQGQQKKKCTADDFKEKGENFMTTGRRNMFLASDDDNSDPDGTSHAAFHKALGNKAAPSIMSSTNLGSAIAYAPQLTPGKKKKKKDEIWSSASEDEKGKGADQANAEADSKEPGKEKEE